MENYSVLMSVYDKETPSNLSRSITSVLKQTIVTNDFVIVCNGILKNELMVVLNNFQRNFPEIVHIFQKQTNEGLSNALAFGLEKTKNNLVGRMDSDDVCVSDRFEKQIKKILEGFDLVGSCISEFESDPQKIIAYRVVPEKNDDIYKFSKKRSPFCHQTILFRKTSVLKAGGYPVDWLACEDYCLFYHMIKAGCRFYNFQESLVCASAGEAMYRRRGRAFNIFTKKLRKEMYRDGFLNFWEYFFVSPLIYIGHSLPPKAKAFLYTHFLREKAY